MRRSRAAGQAATSTTAAARTTLPNPTMMTLRAMCPTCGVAPLSRAAASGRHPLPLELDPDQRPQPTRQHRLDEQMEADRFGASFQTGGTAAADDQDGDIRAVALAHRRDDVSAR